MSAKAIPSRNRTKPVSRIGAGRLQPVQIWAWLGTLLLAGEFYFLAKWVTGDSFVPVPKGPDVPPDWMLTSLRVGEGLMIALWAFCVYWFVIRQWRRAGRLTTDGMIVIGCTLVSPFDMISNSAQYMFTYNAYLINFGNVLSVLPFNLAPHNATASEGWPVLFLTTMYGCFVLVGVLFCAMLRAVKRRWPEANNLVLLAICIPAGMMMDFLIEAVICCPLGFWAYGGGHFNFNAGHYYQFPMLNECLLASFVFTGITSLMYFVDDRGQTICERGLDKLTVSVAQKRFLRFTSVMCGIHLVFFVTFHLPAYLLALHASQWPDDLVNRSYFTNGMCGPQVNLACPGPNTPIARGNAPRLDFSGNFTR